MQKRQKLDYSIPSTEELINLKETALLFKSNLFKLQIDELLREVTPAAIPGPADEQDRKISAPLDKYLRDLKEDIEGMEPSTYVLKPRSMVLDTVPVPFTKPFTFNIKSPSRVTVVGSYLLRTVSKPITNVDIALEFPSDSLLNKDYLNFRYLSKRAALVETVMRSLKKHPSKKYSTKNAKIEVGYFMQDRLKPIIILRPKTAVSGSTGGKLAGQLPKRFARFEIRRVLEDTGFITQLRLVHNTIKGASALAKTLQLLRVWARQRGMYCCFNKQSDRGGGGGGGGLGNGGGINGFVLGFVLVYLVQERIVSRQMSVNQAFKAVIRFLAEHDFQREPIHIKDNNENNKTIGVEVERLLGSYSKAFSMSVVDPNGINVCSRVSEGSYRWLQMQALRSLKLLNEGEQIMRGGGAKLLENEGSDNEDDDYDDNNAATSDDDDNDGMMKEEGEDDVSRGLLGGGGAKNNQRVTKASAAQGLADQAAFKSIFLTPVLPFGGSLDAYFNIYFDINEETITEEEQQEENKFSPITSSPSTTTSSAFGRLLLPTLSGEERLLRKVSSILQRGLGDRIELLLTNMAQRTNQSDDDNNKEKKIIQRKHHIVVGLLLSKDIETTLMYCWCIIIIVLVIVVERFKRIELGPAANDKEAAKQFRAFWGDRSELRRFKDGRINEAVVWDDDEEEEEEEEEERKCSNKGTGKMFSGANILVDLATHLLRRHVKWKSIRIYCGFPLTLETIYK
eukprot:jgi/Bigna1/78753/fgenesh1_pg.57_\